MVRINSKSSFQWWNGTLMTVFTVTNPTGNPDRLESLRRVDIHMVGIDQGGGVAHFTSEADRKAACGGVEGTA